LKNYAGYAKIITENIRKADFKTWVLNKKI